MTLDQWMRDRGREAGFRSNRALADKLGKTHHTVWRWRRGNALPSLPLVFRIQEITGGAVGPNDWSLPGPASDEPADPAPRAAA